MQPVIALLGVAIVFAAAQVTAGESDYRSTPWHLVDLWWDLGEERPFESYSLDVTISAAVPAESNLYIAPIGLGHLSDTPFYGGIQTQADGYTKADQALRKLGPGFLMSMWGERSHEAIRPSLGGFCQSSGHEGDFVSVRRPYAWQPGKYTYRIVRMDRETVDGTDKTWVGAFVYSHALGENIFIGALRFPKDNLMLSRKVASFVEVYGRRIPFEEIPKLTVTYSNPQVNGEPIAPVKVEAIYPKKVPDYADAQWRDGQVVIEVGTPIVDRKQRQVELLTR